ncbi:MAG: poly-gamma-glutamate hydrolase family protein [Promethearchaeota archaeon]
MSDKYNSFNELIREQIEKKDFKRIWKDINSKVLIIAIHGGKIEKGTSILAKAIAKDLFSFYCFEGIRENHNYKILHITSTNFDDPIALNLVKKSKILLSIHGLRGTNFITFVGGRDDSLKESIVRALKSSGFNASIAKDDKSATSKDNICNMNKVKKGVQLEITRGLRDNLLSENNKRKFEKYVNTIREVLLEYQSNI